MQLLQKVIQLLSCQDIDMNMRAVEIKLRDKFNYLCKEYGFVEINNVYDKDFCIIKMKNSTTGIALHYERREADLFVYLYRLVNGEIVDDKTPLSPQLPLNCIELRYIIQFKKSDSFILKYSHESFDELIGDIAADLKLYGNEILNGDFEIFNEVDAIAKKRRLEWQNS
jgi:hypothetical protein